jgi:hypothetical protein
MPSSVRNAVERISAIPASALPPRNAYADPYETAAQRRESLCHGFPAVSDGFLRFFRTARFKNRSENLALGGFRRLRLGLKTVKTAKTGTGGQ